MSRPTRRGIRQGKGKKSLRTEATRALDSGLESIGFRRRRGALERRGLIAIPGRSWCTLQRAARDADSLGGLGEAALWKSVRREDGQVVREFHVPLQVLDLHGGGAASLDGDHDYRIHDYMGDDIDGLDRLAACIEWAEQSASGGVDIWEAPPLDEVRSWLGGEALSVIADGFVHEIALLRAPHRLAFRCTLLERLSPAISAARRAWIRQILLDAQDRWFLARAGWNDPAAGEPAVAVEVDLSGAPECMREPLATAAVAAVRWLTTWIVRPVRFLDDPGIACDAWDRPPERALPAGRR